MNGNALNSPSRPALLLLAVALAIAGLYFAREFLLPLALAVLISFLLAPLTRRLERWHLGRVGAVLTATALAFLVIAVVGSMVAGQLIDLANQLPEYKTNLRAKAAALQTKPNSPLSRVTETLRDITDEITKNGVISTAPNVGSHQPPPVPVAVVYTPGNALQVITGFVAPILGPLGTAAIVIVFVIFMLLEREDLRDRVIHLVGHGRLQMTTQAIDEAGQRVSRYLLAQLIVNVTYGIPIGLGLWWIGIPNAVLWGFLATILRFVPYLGPFIAAAFPLGLSLAISPSWNMPLLTALLFIVVELISNNVVEPWLYGASTGLSPMAVIVSAVFWTWLWGTAGLLLATPLTVCIAVLGKYIPNLSFLDVLLGDKPPIAVEDRFYQRLLAMDAEEALARAEEVCAARGLAAAFDELIVPALRQIELDIRGGAMSDDTRREIYRTLRELVGELGDVPKLPEQDARVLCLPASNEADELAALMLSRLLAEANVPARVLSSKLMSSELIEQTAAAAPHFVCISTAPSGSVIPATHLCKRLRERLDSVVLAVGVWGGSAEDIDRRLQRLKRAHADHVFTALGQAATELRVQPVLVPAIAPEASAA
ncbi:MAG: hypothetical protein QOE70_4131 [Chthoniobacter sp.]|jgi:predicted PurR-regulated permease PerM|nr:hypothetical protein [Chthoniobacter sp.]